VSTSRAVARGTRSTRSREPDPSLSPGRAST
jgi:hypothetical protein